MRFQIKSTVHIYLLCMTILGLAAITQQRVSHDRIQCKVSQGRSKQNRKRPEYVYVSPGNTAANDPSCHQGDSDPLWKILSNVQVKTWTYETSLDLLSNDRFCWDHNRMAAVDANKSLRVFFEGYLGCLLATRACKGNVHARISCREERLN